MADILCARYFPSTMALHERSLSLIKDHGPIETYVVVDHYCLQKGILPVTKCPAKIVEKAFSSAPRSLVLCKPSVHSLWAYLRLRRLLDKEASCTLLASLSMGL